MKTKQQAPIAEAPKKSLKIYCPVYNHIKDTIVCSLCCSLRDRCREFQQFYQENRAAQDASVNDYIESHRHLPPGSLLTIRYQLEVLRTMSDTYVWIGQNDLAEVMTYEQILQAADEGRKPKHIFLTKQELVLRYQLVPKSRQESGKENGKVDVKEAVKPAEPIATEPAPQPAPTVIEPDYEISDKRKKRAGR
jgi:hypothetical protein